MGMDVYGRNPKNETGEYFRASIWSWHPLHLLCKQVTGQDLSTWATNDGAGYTKQAPCTALADKLEHYLKSNRTEAIVAESELQVDASGRFVKSGGRSPYRIDYEHVHEFIAFLRNCGGFRIC